MKRLHKCLLILLVFNTEFLPTLGIVIGQEENAARFGITSQSSDYADWVSTLAVDGMQTTWSHTNTQTDPWWRVDLLRVYRVNRVAVTNRDSNYWRIDGSVIRVGNFPDDIYSNPICAVIASIPSAATETFSCGGMEGRFVIVHIPGVEKILTLCEVGVYGFLAGNVAIEGVATQSSTFDDWFAEKAIDSNRGLLQQFTGCTATSDDSNPWWRLDLGDVYCVNRVVITQRFDCCAERINGAEIRIGNSLKNNGNNNPLCAVITSIPAGESYTYSCAGMEGRYVNVALYGDGLTLCEVEVYIDDPCVKRTLVRFQFNSRSDFTDPTMRNNLLQQLGSALDNRGLINVTLQWTQAPKQEVMKVEDGKRRCAEVK